MPKTYRTAAKSTRDMAEKRRSHLVTVGILTIGALIVIYLLMSNSNNLGIGGIGFLVLLVAFRLVPDLFESYANKKEKTIRRADRGADAEEEIGDLLDELGDDYVVIHDPDSPYGNIDHVVISQFGGIILLETKSHHGTVTTTDNQILVNGDEPEKDFVGLALKNSYWLREEVERLIHVKPWITPIVVFTNAFVKFGKTPKGVRVINQKFLLRTLQSSHSNSSANTIVWENHDLIAAFLSGQQPNPISETDTQVHCCPKCGKRMVEKLAKGGSQVGKRFWVCPDYPSCKTAIPID